MERGGQANRVTLVALALLLAFGALTYRLIDLQIVNASRYSDAAREQRMQLTSVKPQRGSILDRDGEILAYSRDVYSLYATPYQVKDPDKTAAELSLVLGYPQNQLADKLRSSSGFVWLERKMEAETAERIKGLNLAGLGFIKESQRCYPQEYLAAQLLGYVGMDNTGLAGLELQYEEDMAGVPGEVEMERDPTGESIPGLSKVITEPVDGCDLVLTLDMDIQYKAETELALAVQAAQAKGGNLVIMDVRSGEILAMATCPSFDANLYPEASSEMTRNRPVTDVFEPGSVLKVTTAAAALGEMIVSPTSVIHLPSQITIGEYTFKDSHEMISDDLTFSDVIAYSSNLGTIKTAMQLDEEVFWQYLDRMGIGRATGVDFPGEAVGLLPDPEDWSSTSAATIAIGQGVSVTTLQLAQILGCVGNKGIMVTPHFLKETVDKETEETLGFEGEATQVLNQDVAYKLSRVLEQVVQHGTATRASTNLYNTAGKTGTAMKPNPRGGYLKSYIATFAGFAPSEDSRLAMVVTLDEPATIYGGIAAAPCFSTVMEFALQHLRVPPSEVKVNTREQVKVQ